jgi:hypothetical protein
VIDASKVDFRNPENFFHDVNSVAGLLKQFFRDLPDPLLTQEHYAGFIDAASRSPQHPLIPLTTPNILTQPHRTRRRHNPPRLPPRNHQCTPRSQLCHSPRHHSPLTPRGPKFVRKQDERFESCDRVWSYAYGCEYWAGYTGCWVAG